LDKRVIELLKSLNQNYTEIEVLPINRIGNNKTALVKTNNGLFFAKQYFDSINDKRDRFNTELNFINYAVKCSSRNIPEVIAFDYYNKLIIFQYIDGQNFIGKLIDKELVYKAASFFSSINKNEFKNKFTQQITKASEACFSINQHLELVKKRIHILKKSINISREDTSVISTLSCLIDCYKKIEKEILEFAFQNNIDVVSEINISNRVISPSDFGFHNCILSNEAKIIFIDFEYSGWDDPAKLAGDFFSQLQVPVSEDYFDFFVKKAFENLNDKEEMAIRAKLLLPLYKLKWACIAMNIFIPVNLERRVFSNPMLNIEEYKFSQIKKANEILQIIQNNNYNAIH